MVEECSSGSYGAPTTVSGGVCLMSSSWRDRNDPSFIHFVSSFLAANCYRLNFLTIAPDFIINNGGSSVAFNFVVQWDPLDSPAVFSRVEKLKRAFRHFYLVLCLPTKGHHDSFNCSFINRYGMQFGNPSVVPVRNPEMGFEQIVQIAHAHGVVKREDAVSKMRIEREQQMQRMDMFTGVVTSIPGIDIHDCNALFQAIGSIEEISKASKSFILENTDLSAEKAETIVRFFRDPNYYLRPKIT